MKPQKLYKAINLIDDDLIENALDIRPMQNIISFRKYVALAACLCIMIVSIFSMNRSEGTNIYINEIQGLMMKSVDVDMSVRYLSETEVKNYFEEFTLPDQLMSYLTLDKQNAFKFLIDDQKRIYDDSSVFVYRFGEQKVEIKLSKIGLEYGDIFNDGMKKKVSRIKNTELMIGSYIDYRMDEDVDETHVFAAEYKQEDIFIKISSIGMGQDEFIDMLEELINLNVD